MEHQNDMDINLIDKYLAGTLSEEEKTLFEQKLAQPQFKEKLELVQAIKKGVAAEKTQQMKSFLQNEEKKITTPEQTDTPTAKTKQLPRNFLRIAAGFLVLLALSFWLWNKNDQGTTHLYTQHFSPEKNVLYITKKSEPDLSRKYEIFKAYDDGNYTEYIKGVDALLTDEDNDDYRFYKANALLELNQTDEAISILKKIIAAEKTQFMEESKFILALAYLRVNQKEAARPILEELSINAVYKEKVEKILSKL